MLPAGFACNELAGTADQRVWQQYFNYFNQPSEKAAAKANRLLKKFLTTEQWKEYQATERFPVIVGKKRYVLGKDLQVRVYNADDYVFAPPRETWCVRLPGTPIADTLLAQLLMLRDDPKRLRYLACVTSRHRPGYQDGGRAHALRIMRRAGY